MKKDSPSPFYKEETGGSKILKHVLKITHLAGFKFGLKMIQNIVFFL